MRPTLLEATTLAPRRGDPAHLAVLVGGVADPVDARVVPDGLVRLVDHDHLKPAVARILPAPVAVEDAQAADLAPDALLRDGPQVPRGLHLVHAGIARLPVHNPLCHHLLPPTAANARPKDNIALLRLVPEHARLLRTARPGAAADRRQLTVLPRTQAEKEAHHIRLLLLPELVEVLIRPHHAVFEV